MILKIIAILFLYIISTINIVFAFNSPLSGIVLDSMSFIAGFIGLVVTTIFLIKCVKGEENE